MLLVTGFALAQSPVSGFMKKKGEGSVVLTQFRESYDRVFLVPTEVDGVPVFNEVTISSTSLYGEFGISDRFNVIVNLPYHCIIFGKVVAVHILKVKEMLPRQFCRITDLKMKDPVSKTSKSMVSIASCQKQWVLTNWIS